MTPSTVTPSLVVQSSSTSTRQTPVGAWEGDSLGEALGWSLGKLLGEALGEALGWLLGESLGGELGSELGDGVGSTDLSMRSNLSFSISSQIGPLTSDEAFTLADAQ